MLGPHDAVPTRKEIMTYFEDKIIKAVQTWQGSDGGTVGSNVLNDFVKEMTENLTQRLGEQIAISDVSQLTILGSVSYSSLCLTGIENGQSQCHQCRQKLRVHCHSN